MLRTDTFVVTADGRDKGGVFTLTERPAVQASDWFIRAMQLMVRSGADVPANILQLGAAGVVTIGIGTVLTGVSKAHWGEVKPLLDELLTCVTSYQPPGGTMPLTGPTMMTQVQEATTIFQLYEEVVSLHLGFSLLARLSTFREMAASMMAALTPNTETSIEPSPSLSQAASLN